jgi:hypothetical protein
MKKVVFPDVSFNARTEDGLRSISIGEQLHIISASPSKPGDVFTIDQIRARLPLVEKLAALTDEGEILLEDNEWTELLQAVEQSTWSGVSEAAIALLDAVREATTVTVEEKGG